MKQTAVEWLYHELDNILPEMYPHEWDEFKIAIQKAKEMEKEQMGYTKEDVLKAGEMGEINHHDVKHIVSYLDEARQYNKTFNVNKQ